MVSSSMASVRFHSRQLMVGGLWRREELMNPMTYDSFLKQCAGTWTTRAHPYSMDYNLLDVNRCCWI